MRELLPTIMLVDDTEYNLKVLKTYLKDEPYNIITCRNGEEAWDIISKSNPDDIYTIVLDRVMPGIDGIEVLERIKSHPDLDILPVILETSRSSEKDVLDGITAGATYYLTKPFTKEKLCAVVKSTVTRYRRFLATREECIRGQRGPILMQNGNFKYKTLQEANDLGLLLANACYDPRRVITGISELLINSIEHGNLDINYDDKSKLVDAQKWTDEINRRLALPENQNKYAYVSFEKKDTEIVINIRDQGKGFDFKKYLEFSPDRAYDSHGRGIYMAKSMSFDSIQYHGSGNHVEIKIYKDEPRK